MSKINQIQTHFLNKAKKRKRKIGIGIINPRPSVLRGLKQAKKYADLTIVGRRIPGFKNIPARTDDEASQKLVSLLKNREIEGLVVGQLKASYTYHEFCRQFKKPEESLEEKICACVIQSPNGWSFVSGSPSLYQGMTLNYKIKETERLAKYIKEELGLEPKIAVMASRRPSGQAGKYPIIEEDFQRAEELTKYLLRKSYNVKNFYIEYEKAMEWGANLIMPPFGIVGNTIFRVLTYLAGWQLINTTFLDTGEVYEGGSRNENDYFNHIVVAVAAANKNLR